MEERDVVIIGGGPAGYAAAIRVSQLGGKATLVEGDALGGTCLNRGCIPARVLARAAEFIEMGLRAKDYGVIFKEKEVDFAKLMARKDVVVKTLVGGIRLLLTGNQVEIVEGDARFIDSSTIGVALKDGTNRTISARHSIIASGSRSRKESVPGIAADRVLDPSDAFGLKEIPKSILVIGAGYVGVSLAAIFSRLGTKVTLLGESSRMLDGIDAEIVTAFERELKKNKVLYHSESGIAKVRDGGDGEMDIFLEKKGEEVKVSAQWILAAEARDANTDGIGLEALGIGLDEKKGIVVNSRMESGVRGIYAAGDVTMKYMWTPVAYMEGIVAAENVMGKNSTMDYSTVPFWTNTIPGIAAVGLTEDEARGKGYEVRVGRFPFAGNGMATIMGERTGLVKIVAEKKYGQILGIHILGPGAADLIAEAALAMKLEITPEDIGAVLHVHPSLSEAFWEAARDVNGDTLHFVSQNR
jgi:dihydrolipoamide dehydrogenase